MTAIIFITIITAIIIIAGVIYHKSKQNPLQITKKQKRRLGISAKIMIDKNQNLILVRRDNVEHLIYVNNEKATLIESNIQQKQDIHSQYNEKEQNILAKYAKNIFKKTHADTEKYPESKQHTQHQKTQKDKMTMPNNNTENDTLQKQKEPILPPRKFS